MFETTKALYLKQIKAGYERDLETYEQGLAEWRKSVDPNHAFGFGPPASPAYTALVEAFLYTVEGDRTCAERARARLVTYRQFADVYPPDYHQSRWEYEDGLPPIGSMFTLPPYLQAYLWIKDSGVFSPEDHRTVEGLVADSMPAFFRFPEWGAHNRTALRAWAMALAAKAFPDHPDAPDWGQIARVFGDDSLKGWSIEDAMLYHAIWTHAMINYADALGDAAYFRRVNAKYYFDYYVSLMSPAGMLADFGDSNWRTNWPYFIACLERGAREYQDPHMRWAAGHIYETFFEESGRDERFGSPFTFIFAYLWMDETVKPEKPTAGTQEALDEVIGKKVVFRSGWERDSTFLLLNYKPETDYGFAGRENTKNTLVVEAEKTHHGHSDENAICLLMSRGQVLLHDSGYRERLPNGKYRADMYHNRIVARPELLRRDDDALGFLHDDGHHRPMETQRIDFYTFEEVDFSRTRATDRAMGYRWDRIVAYLKAEDLFVIFDGVEALRPNRLAVCNLFYTHEILGRGPGWFNTRIGKLDGYGPEDGPASLLIVMPQAPDRWEGSQVTRRYFMDETCVYQAHCADFRPRDFAAFITVLIPTDRKADAAEIAGRVSVAEVSRSPRASAVTLATGGRRITVGVKLDLEDEILLSNIRPKYSYASGATTYGDVETDARFVYCAEAGGRLSYAFTEAVRLRYRGQDIFAPKGCSFPLQYEGPWMINSIAKWRAWEKTNIQIR